MAIWISPAHAIANPNNSAMSVIALTKKRSDLTFASQHAAQKTSAIRVSTARSFMVIFVWSGGPVLSVGFEGSCVLLLGSEPSRRLNNPQCVRRSECG